MLNKLTYSVLLILIASCGSIYQPQKITYYDYRISQYRNTDSTFIQLLKPYSDSVNKTMYNVIGDLITPLEKKQPNGSMGMVFVDAQREMAALKYHKKVDAAFINNGGLRVPSISAGKLTVGKIYEVMPFDNLLILQTVDGKVLQEFLDLIARKGGWPVSGVTFNIVNGKAANVKIGNEPLDVAKKYTIANSDYIANGGDDCEMLKKVPQENNYILLRDVFIEYFKMQTAKGIKIEAPEEERIKKM
jgi:2',3'-cyclic-nucleotide 2'-phosphodiesterase (5'-nucleotidase family)